MKTNVISVISVRIRSVFIPIAKSSGSTDPDHTKQLRHWLSCLVPSIRALQPREAIESLRTPRVGRTFDGHPPRDTRGNDPRDLKSRTQLPRRGNAVGTVPFSYNPFFRFLVGTVFSLPTNQPKQYFSFFFDETNGAIELIFHSQPEQSNVEPSRLVLGDTAPCMQVKIVVETTQTRPCLSYNSYFLVFLARTVFFSHNKSGRTIFWLIFLRSERAQMDQAISLFAG